MLRILGFLKPYKWQVTGMIALLILQITGTLYIPTMTANIINQGILRQNMSVVWQTGGLMIAIALGTALVSILGTYLSSNLASLLGRDTRNALVRKTQNLSLNDFDRFGTASIITRTTNDVVLIQQTFSQAVEMILPAPVMIVVGLSLIFSKSVSLGWIVIVGMLGVVALALLIGLKALPQFEKMQTMLDDINKKLRETITGVRVIRAFNREGDEKDNLNAHFKDYADTGIRVNKLFAYAWPGMLLIINFLTILVVWLGGNQASAGTMGIGDITAIIEYIGLILMYLIMAIMISISIPRAEVSAARIYQVLDHKLEFDDNQSEKTPKVAQASKLEFRHVTFRYQGAEEPVLNDVSFTVDIGETFAIIGGTGSGKSTIVQLIPEFYKIESGQILLDGVDIRHLSQEELRKRISIVPQRAFLFSGTIADNMRHGKADATQEEMYHALDIAQAQDFVKNLPDGLESYVAQAGNNFSGGQKQRLAIARALIKPAEVFVFDDSFSALDYKTDAALRRRLKQEMLDKAMIIVAQRISTIMDAKQIVVLDQGKVVGLGNHEDLIRHNQTYREIAASQFSQEEMQAYDSNEQTN